MKFSGVRAMLGCRSQNATMSSLVKFIVSPSALLEIPGSRFGACTPQKTCSRYRPRSVLVLVYRTHQGLSEEVCSSRIRMPQDSFEHRQTPLTRPGVSSSLSSFKSFIVPLGVFRISNNTWHGCYNWRRLPAGRSPQQSPIKGKSGGNCEKLLRASFCPAFVGLRLRQPECGSSGSRTDGCLSCFLRKSRPWQGRRGRRDAEERDRLVNAWTLHC